MTFQELVDAVVNLTNRPELVEETKHAVQRSTLKMHTIDFFPKDLTVETFTVNAAFGDISLAHIPRIRKIHKVLAQSLSGKFEVLQPLQIDKMLGFGAHSIVGYFMAGNKMSFRCRETVYNIQIALYQLPDVQPKTFKSWIADLYPYAIIDDACASILTDTGNLDIAARFLARVGTKDSDVLSAHVPTILAEQLYQYEIAETEHKIKY